MSTHQLRLFCYYLGYLSTYIYWGEESSAGLRVKQVGEREHERRALPGGSGVTRGPEETRNQRPEARGYNITRTSLSSPARIPRGKKPEETEIQCVTSRRVTTTTTTRVCEVTQCCCEGKRELYGCALSNCGSVAAWQQAARQHGSLTARQPSPNNALALAHGLGPWALFLPWSWVSLPCLVLCVLLN